MAIPPGTKLGPSEVVAQIGAGGMGEVYQARDTKLGRDVAIKVLPEAFAHVPDRLSPRLKNSFAIVGFRAILSRPHLDLS